MKHGYTSLHIIVSLSLFVCIAAVTVNAQNNYHESEQVSTKTVGFGLAANVHTARGLGGGLFVGLGSAVEVELSVGVDPKFLLIAIDENARYALSFRIDPDSKYLPRVEIAYVYVHYLQNNNQDDCINVGIELYRGNAGLFSFVLDAGCIIIRESRFSGHRYKLEPSIGIALRIIII
jgi:hypothetical protein